MVKHVKFYTALAVLMQCVIGPAQAIISPHDLERKARELCHNFYPVPADADVMFFPAGRSDGVLHWRNFVVDTRSKTVHVIDDLLYGDAKTQALGERSLERKTMDLLLE